MLQNGDREGVVPLPTIVMAILFGCESHLSPKGVGGMEIDTQSTDTTVDKTSWKVNMGSA
jgi:hypothetical protein